MSTMKSIYLGYNAVIPVNLIIFHHNSAHSIIVNVSIYGRHPLWAISAIVRPCFSIIQFYGTNKLYVQAHNTIQLSTISKMPLPGLTKCYAGGIILTIKISLV